MLNMFIVSCEVEIVNFNYVYIVMNLTNDLTFPRLVYIIIVLREKHKTGSGMADKI